MVDDLHVRHGLAVAEAERANGGMVDVEGCRIAEECLGQIVGVSHAGIGFARADGAAGGDEDRGSRDGGRALTHRRSL
jgi:hypothetical protein